MDLRGGIEIDLTGDTCKAPEVLILEVRAIAPAHDLHGDEVTAWLQVFRDIELGCDLGVLRVAYVLAIDPDEEVARG